MKTAAQYINWSPTDRDSVKTLKDLKLPGKGIYVFNVTYRPSNQKAPVHIYAIKAPDGQVFKTGDEFNEISNAAYSFLQDQLKSKTSSLDRIASSLEKAGFIELATELDMISKLAVDEDDEDDERYSTLRRPHLRLGRLA